MRRSRYHPAARLALAATIALAGCKVKLELPGGAQVTCTSDADCPNGTICRTTLGTCVAPGGDVTPPELVTSTILVSPGRVGRNTPAITVSFQVSEALAADPAVSLGLAGAGQTRTMSLESKDTTAHSYVFTYAPAPASDPEGDVSLVVNLVDTTGNQGHAEIPREAVLDFTPPGLALDNGGAPVVAIGFTPPATSPLRDVTAATVGTKLRVDFAASETLRGGTDSPVVTLGTGAAAVTLAQISGNGLSYVYETTVAAGFPEGPAPLAAHLTDLAGNGADVSLGTVQVTTTPPASPAVGTPDAVLFHRLPWGSDATGGAEAYFMRGLAGSVPASSLVVVYSSADVVSGGALIGREIGRVQADATGAFGGDVGSSSPFQLFMGDAPDVYVAAVDAAGNVSDADGVGSNGVQAARVHDVAWTATMQGKIPGRTFPNPHGFEGRQAWTATLAQNGSKPVSSPGDVGLVDSARASVRGAPYWLPARTYGPLSIRGGTGMAHDPVRGCRLAFGGIGWDGCDGGSYCGQWESCRGNSWHAPAIGDPEGDGNPSLGSDIPLVFAGGRGAVVLSDGTDLWEWNGSSWRKIVMADPEGDGNPPARKNHAVAYDEARQRLVLFGGLPKGGGAPLRDTWETDFRSWKKVCTAAPCSTTMPPARSRHAMTYDPVRKVTLLVGGDLTSGYDSATWTWNGSAWTSACSTGTCATVGQRSMHRLAFDPGRGVAVTFGGHTAGGVDGGLFEWNGSAWTAACTGSPCNATRPAGREEAALFYDASRGRTVLANGDVGAFATVSECVSNWCATEWEWDGSAWTQVLAVPPGPPTVTGAVPVYDPATDDVVLFGGQNNSSALTNDTWLWDGSSWTASVAAKPVVRSGYAATYAVVGLSPLLPTTAVAVVDGTGSGGALNWSMMWDGSAWSSLGNTTPSARTKTAVAQLPPANSRQYGGPVVMYGGMDGAGNAICDTWQLNGLSATATWSNTPSGCPGPGARQSHAMVRADGFSGSPVVLFGGTSGGISAPVNDVWNFNGTTWTQASAGGAASATQPPARVDGDLLWDGGRNRVLLYGGTPGPAVSLINCVDDYGGFPCHDFWEWDGVAWTRVFPVDLYGDANPDPGRLVGIAFDTTRGMGVGVVGNPATSATMDTWWWHGGASDRPGEVMTVVFDAAQVQGPYDVLDLAVRWRGGGSGTPGGTATPGASLEIWDNTAWRALVSSSTASPAAPEDLSWTLSGDAQLGSIPAAERQRFMVGDQRLLELALVPAAASGSAAGFGEASTDYAEVTVKYRTTGP